MKMQHKVLTAALAVALCGLAGTVSADQYSGTDGTITINGTVVPQTCTVANGGAVTVNLPDVLQTALATAGNTAGDTAFSIDISDCDAALGNVQALFTGGNINSTNGRLDNSGTAANVQVQILNGSDAVMDLSGATMSAQSQLVTTLSGGDASIAYTARYYANGGAAGAGDVQATVDFTLTYN
ncbi:MAG TPA: fimbrial protein [Rhodanobacteraceae bacterium]|nr:fimbrial protein [Rhodanobacteraceae bacterium]